MDRVVIYAGKERIVIAKTFYVNAFNIKSVVSDGNLCRWGLCIVLHVGEPLTIYVKHRWR